MRWATTALHAESAHGCSAGHVDGRSATPLPDEISPAGSVPRPTLLCKQITQRWACAICATLTTAAQSLDEISQPSFGVHHGQRCLHRIGCRQGQTADGRTAPRPTLLDPAQQATPRAPKRPPGAPQNGKNDEKLRKMRKNVEKWGKLVKNEEKLGKIGKMGKHGEK